MQQFPFTREGGWENFFTPKPLTWPSTCDDWMLMKDDAKRPICIGIITRLIEQRWPNWSRPDSIAQLTKVTTMVKQLNSLTACKCVFFQFFHKTLLLADQRVYPTTGNAISHLVMRRSLKTIYFINPTKMLISTVSYAERKSSLAYNYNYLILANVPR